MALNIKHLKNSYSYRVMTTNEFIFNCLLQAREELEELQTKILKLEELSNIHNPEYIKLLIKKGQTAYLKSTDYALISKKCTSCNEIRDLNSFHKSKNGRYGRHSKCKLCTCNNK